MIAAYPESMVDPFKRCVAEAASHPLVDVLIDWWNNLKEKPEAEVPDLLHNTEPTSEDIDMLHGATSRAIQEYSSLGFLWAPQ